MKQKSNRLECVLNSQALLGESPLWSWQDGCLYWVDILFGKLFKFEPKNGKNEELLSLSNYLTAVGLCEDRRLILALEKSIAIFNLQNQSLDYLSELEKDQPDNRLNDGKCDRQGRFWCGTMNQTNLEADTGCLYRMDSKQGVQSMQEHVKLSNGIGWSPDNCTMYFTESKRSTIFAYDFETKNGTISNRRPLIELPPFSIDGPDGLTVDEEGYIWSAHYGEGRVVRYDPEGRLDREIEVPVPRVTSCIFGGETLETLYITTAREHMDRQQIKQFPLSGSVFAIQLGVKGIPEGCYKI